MALSSSIVIYLLIFATFTMHLALKPKRRVLKVSFSFKIDGEQVIIKVVKEFPPNDSYSNLVSFESLKEIKFYFSTI